MLHLLIHMTAVAFQFIQRYRFAKNIGLFGRWDYLSSKGKWDEANDGNAGIVGADFKLGKYVGLCHRTSVYGHPDKTQGKSVLCLSECLILSIKIAIKKH